MKKFIKLIFTMVVAVMILMQAIVISNASSLTVSLSTTTTTVEKGKELSVLVSLANIDVGEGVNTLKGKISYDSNILEYVNNEAQNGWAVTYNSNDGTLLVVYMSGLVAKDQGIAKLTFKVKDTATEGTTQVGLSNVESSNADEKVTPADASLSVQIGAQSGNSDNGDDNNNGGNNNNQNNGGDSQNGGTSGGSTNSGTSSSGSGTSTRTNTSTSGSSSSSTKAPTSIPYTGNNNIVFIVLGLVAIAIGAISLVKYKKYKGI